MSWCIRAPGMKKPVMIQKRLNSEYKTNIISKLVDLKIYIKKNKLTHKAASREHCSLLEKNALLIQVCEFAWILNADIYKVSMYTIPMTKTYVSLRLQKGHCHKKYSSHVYESSNCNKTWKPFIHLWNLNMA